MNCKKNKMTSKTSDKERVGKTKQIPQNIVGLPSMWGCQELLSPEGGSVSTRRELL